MCTPSRLERNHFFHDGTASCWMTRTLLSPLHDLLEQAADAGRHFDADVIAFGMPLRRWQRCFPMPQPIGMRRRAAAEHGAGEQDRRSDTEARQQRLMRAALRVGNAALAQHIAADPRLFRGHDAVGGRASGELRVCRSFRR
jgi:hypothetical protein